MAQGGVKLGTTKRSKGAQRRKVAVKKTVTKGRKAYNAKGRAAVVAKGITATTKAINRKNEAMVCARAVASGDKFFLSEIRETGRAELKSQTSQRSKKEERANNVTSRMKLQLKKLGRDVES